MNKLAELRAHLAAQKGKAKAILARADKETDLLSAEDEAEFQDLEDDIATTEAEIAAAETMARRRQSLAATAVMAGGPALDNITREEDPAVTGGFADLAEFATTVREASVHGGVVDSRLVAGPDTHIGAGASGEGFTVPPQYTNRIWDLVSDLNPVFDLCDVEPTNQRQINMSADETTPWGATGVKSYWRAEAGKMKPSRMADSGRSVVVQDLYAFVEATEELLQDSPRLANRLEMKAAQAIDWTLDEAVINGDGVGKPLGWRKSKALVIVPKKSGQAAGSIVADNILKMFERFMMVPGDSPLWIANTNTLSQLATITIGDRPAWLPGSGLAGAPLGTLMGIPVRFDEHAETVGSEGDLQLVSPQGWYGARRSNTQFARSIHLYFDQGIEAFRWTVRVGGQPHLSKPVTPAKSAGAKSHFVTLATRA